LAANFRAGDEDKKVFTATSGFSIRAHMGNFDFSVGERFCLFDQIADSIQVVAGPNLGSSGCRAEDGEQCPSVSHNQTYPLIVSF
jgi:hypothetical protein